MNRTIPIALYINPDIDIDEAGVGEKFRFDPAPGFHLITGDACEAALNAYEDISHQLTIMVYEHPVIARAIFNRMDANIDEPDAFAGKAVTGEGVLITLDEETSVQYAYDHRENPSSDFKIVLSAWIATEAEFDSLREVTSASAVKMSQWLTGLAAEVSLDVVHHTQIALESVTGAYIAPASISLQDLEANMGETFPEELRDQIHNEVLSSCQDMETDSSFFPDDLDEKARAVMGVDDPAP